MSVPASAHAVDPAVTVLNRGSELILDGLGNACLGYFAAATFTVINPIQGAIFCAVNAVVSKAFNFLVGDLKDNPGLNLASWLLIRGIEITICATISATVCTFLIGFPLTFEAALILTGANYLASALIASIIALAEIVIIR